MNDHSINGFRAYRHIHLPASHGHTLRFQPHFEYCIGLTSIEIPSSIISIGDAGFYNCEYLMSIDIPSSVKKIGANAFEGCDKLVIKGYAGSYAEQYAKENGISFKAIEE